VTFPLSSQSSASVEDRDLLRRAAERPECPEAADCTAERLLAITREHGIDFATAVFFDRVSRHPANATFIQRTHAQSLPSTVPPTLVGIVPGAFHRQHRQHRNTGADGARIHPIAASMGCPCEVVPLRNFGSPSVNARILVDWLRIHAGQRILLVSLSKGAADLKTALALPEASDLFRSVVAWISLSGLVQGSALPLWLRQHPWRRFAVALYLRWHGERISVAEELRRGLDAPLDPWPALPPHLRIVHFIGVPLRRHLAHPWAPRAYERLSQWGPNDGGAIQLGDFAQVPGIVFPVWGADHYLEPAWDMASLVHRAAIAVIREASAERHAHRSATQPSTAPASKSTA
jgi:hypothetical protein